MMFDRMLLKLLLKYNISLQTLKSTAFKLLFICGVLWLLFYVPTTIVQVLIVCYFLFTSYINFLESDKFWGQKDFLLLGFSPRMYSALFFRTYLMQRLIIDGLIESICLLLGLGVVLWLQAPTTLYWYCITVLCYVVVQPAYFLLKVQIKSGISIRLLTDTIFVLVLIIGVVLQHPLLMNTYFVLPTFFDQVIFTFGHVCYIVAFYTIVLKIRSNAETGINIRRLFLPIKKWNLELFKDFVLLRQDLIVGIISILAYFIMEHFFNIDEDSQLVKKYGIIFFMLSFNLFSSKRARKYLLYDADHYFFANVRFCGGDKKALWRSKFFMIHVNSLIKILVCSFLLLPHDLSMFLIVAVGIINNSNYLYNKVRRKYDNKNNALEILIQSLDTVTVICLCVNPKVFLLIIYVVTTFLYNLIELGFRGEVYEKN